jgi:hypothetical protein
VCFDDRGHGGVIKEQDGEARLEENQLRLAARKENFASGVPHSRTGLARVGFQEGPFAIVRVTIAERAEEAAFQAIPCFAVIAQRADVFQIEPAGSEGASDPMRRAGPDIGIVRVVARQIDRIGRKWSGWFDG